MVSRILKTLFENGRWGLNGDVLRQPAKGMIEPHSDSPTAFSSLIDDGVEYLSRSLSQAKTLFLIRVGTLLIKCFS
jgi:hypothetical protein